VIIENGQGVRGRLWGWAGQQLARYGGLLEAAAVERPETIGESVTRGAAEYAVRWVYAENKRLYQRLHAWGLADYPMAAAWNPVPAVAGFYVANVLFGDLEIVAEQRPTVDGGESSEQENEALVEAVGRVQEWSNFITLKQELVRAAAVFGDVVIKVAERTDGAGNVTGVYLQLLPVESIRYCRVDERGIVQEMRIDTPRMTSIFGTAEREHVLVEIWRKSWVDDDQGGVRFYEVEGRQEVRDEELPAAVGAQTFGELGYDFVPLVWARCETPWWEMTDQIDYYNLLARKSARLNVPLGVVRANAMDSDGRPLPAPPIDNNRLQATYQEVGDGAAAVMRLPGRTEFDWSNGPIDFAALHRDMEDVRLGVEESLPEYRVSKLDASTQIAAETLDMLLRQAGQRVLDMRGTLERALVRGQMMALTLGQQAGLPGFARDDIGNYEAADFGHGFVERDVFEPSPPTMAKTLKELVAAGMPVKLALVAAGFGQAVVEAYDEAAAEQAVRERVTLAGALVRARQDVDSGVADNRATRI
jgi:hypothetical protein